MCAGLVCDGNHSKLQGKIYLLWGKGGGGSVTIRNDNDNNDYGMVTQISRSTRITSVWGQKKTRTFRYCS